jgi:hypothetical protein
MVTAAPGQLVQRCRHQARDLALVFACPVGAAEDGFADRLSLKRRVPAHRFAQRPARAAQRTPLTTIPPE